MYVGITARLQSMVMKQANAMENREHSALGECPVPDLSESDVEEMFWDGHLHLRNAIPAVWKKQTEYVNARIEVELTSGATSTHQIQPRFNVDSIDVPLSFNKYTAHDLSHIPALAETVVWARNAGEVTERWAKVKEDINSFLAHCKSLNEALRLYPDIAIYIPTPFLDMVAKKKEEKAKEPSKAAGILATMDTDRLKAAAVIARMS